eukprot:931036-Lingulodinium_polyedra.AAC.1
MAARMQVECPGNHKHRQLIGGNVTGPSAYYPEEFARRAVRAMIEDSAPSFNDFLKDVSQAGTRQTECEEEALVARRPDAKDGAPLDPQEYERIHRWLTAIHRGSGHSSVASM